MRPCSADWDIEDEIIDLFDIVIPDAVDLGSFVSSLPHSNLSYSAEPGLTYC